MGLMSPEIHAPWGTVTSISSTAGQNATRRAVHLLGASRCTYGKPQTTRPNGTDEAKSLFPALLHLFANGTPLVASLVHRLGLSWNVGTRSDAPSDATEQMHPTWTEPWMRFDARKVAVGLRRLLGGRGCGRSVSSSRWEQLGFGPVVCDQGPEALAGLGCVFS